MGGWTGERGPLTQGEAGLAERLRLRGLLRRGKESALRSRALGEGGHNDISKHHVEGGLPYARGDSEDRIRTEEQKCHEGK